MRATRRANFFFLRIVCDMQLVYCGQDDSHTRIGYGAQPWNFLGELGHFVIDTALRAIDNQIDVSVQMHGIHRTSVGEAPAQHRGHCPPASRDAGQGRTGTPESRVFLRWLRFRRDGGNLSRGAVLKLGRVAHSGRVFPPNIAVRVPARSASLSDQKGLCVLKTTTLRVGGRPSDRKTRARRSALSSATSHRVFTAVKIAE